MSQEAPTQDAEEHSYEHYLQREIERGRAYFAEGHIVITEHYRLTPEMWERFRQSLKT